MHFILNYIFNLFLINDYDVRLIINQLAYYPSNYQVWSGYYPQFTSK